MSAPPSIEYDTHSIFTADGDTLIPTGLASGPWYPGTQHGSAMIGILARAVDRHPSPRPMQVARLTVDMMRAAPTTPVTTPTRVLRAGKSTEFLEASIESAGEVHAHATALRIRQAEIDTGDEPSFYGASGGAIDRMRDAEGLIRPPADQGELTLTREDSPSVEAFHLALEMRPAIGCEVPAMWFRMRCPLVAGETLTPFVRASLVSDWTYSLPFMSSAFADPSKLEEEGNFSAINPDTSINVVRPMQGEWLFMQGQIHYGAIGAGVALAHAFDERGPIGHFSQSILLRGPHRQPPTLEELAGREQQHGKPGR